MTKYTLEDDFDLNISNIPTSEEIEKEEEQKLIPTSSSDNQPFQYTLETDDDEDIFSGIAKEDKPRTSFTSVYDFENDEDVKRDFDIVAGALGERGEGIAETLRDSDFNLYSAFKRSGQAKNFTQAEKEAYNRLVNKFSNTKLKGFYEHFDLIRNFTVDTVTDPLTILSIIAAPFTGGMSVAAKQAATSAALTGAKRYAMAKAIQAKATRPAVFTALEGATFTGLHDYYNQDIDISLDNRENIDWGQVAKSSGIGGGVGFGLGSLLGVYSGAKYYNRLHKYHNENDILKHVDGLDRETIKTADDITAANKDFYKDKKTVGGKTTEDYLDLLIAKLPFFGKATSEFRSAAKRSSEIKKILLSLRYDSTRTIFGKKQAEESIGPLSLFENLANYTGEYVGLGINRAFNHIGKVRGGKITKKDNNALHTLMLDDSAQKFRHSDGLDYDIPKRVKEAYFGKQDTGMKGIKQILDDIFEEGVNLGEFSRTQKIINYFPRVFNYGVLSKNQESFKGLLKDYGYATPNNSVNEEKYLTKYVTASGKEEVGIPADTLGVDLDVFGVDFIQEAKRKLGADATDSQISNLAQDLKANRIVKDMLDLRYDTFKAGVGPRAGSKGFQQHRIFNNIPDEKLGDFLDNSGNSFVSNDVMEVLSDYTQNVAQLFARKKTFGVRNGTEFDDKILSKVREELKILGAKDEQIEITAAGLRNLFEEVTGLGNAGGLAPTGTFGRLANTSSEAVRLSQQAAHLAFAVPSSITEPLLLFQRVGVRDYPRVVLNIAEGLAKEIKKDISQLYQVTKANLGLGKARYSDFDDEYWQELYAGGIAMENNILEGLDRLASGERFYNKSIRKGSDLFFKMSLLTQWTRAVQGAAFTSGKMLIQRNLQKLYDHKLGIAKLSEGNFRNLGMNKKAYLEKQLQELGIDPEEGMAWYRSSLDDNLDFNPEKAQNSPFYKEKYLEGAKRFTNEIILNPNRAAAAKSTVMSSGLGKVAFQFASYPTLFNNIVIKRMINELNEFPVQTAPKLLITGFLMTSIAMWMNQLRNPERHEKLSDEENVLEGLERWGALAQGANLKKGIDAAKYGSGPVGITTRAVFGPTVGDALDSLEYKLGPSTLVTRNLPFQQPIKRLFPEEFKELRERSRENDKTFFGLIDEDDTRGLYRTGGPVVGVPNAPDRPEERINKYTGVPYDLEAGPTAQPEKDRKGFSEEGKLLATLQRRQKKFAGGAEYLVEDTVLDMVKDKSWFKRATDPEGELYKGKHTLLTTSMEADGKEYLFPTIREVNGKLKKLSNQDAFKEAMRKKDFLVFEGKDKREQATEVSKIISNLIMPTRKSKQK